MGETVFLHEGTDPKMAMASEKARATFKFFWRELYWERRRVIPALDFAMIKLSFSDGDEKARDDGNPGVEHMWVNEVDFDGVTLSGVLANSPNWLTSVKAGDHVRVPFDQLGDWMYSFDGMAHGGYTVHLMRQEMSRVERKSHDSAWGLDFGDPNHVRVIRQENNKSNKGLGNLFGKKEEPAPVDPLTLEFFDHPMCINMLDTYDGQLKEEPDLLSHRYDDGWMLIHHEALAGNLAMVKLLLKHGCDPHVPLPDGRKPADLAASLGWDPVVEALNSWDL